MTAPRESETASQDSCTQATPKKESGLKRLVQIADREITHYRSTDGNVMVAHSMSPHLAYPLSSSFCPPVARVQVEYHNRFDDPVTTSMCSNLKEMIRAYATLEEPTEVHLRCARIKDEIWLDTGWAGGEVIRLNANGWQILTESPAIFTRSNITAELPDPRNCEKDLSRLEKYVHCVEEDIPLIWAALIMTWFEGAPQPVFSLLGSADSGKSTAMRFLTDLVDPSTTQTGGSLPKDPRDFKALAKTRRILAFDNVSYLDASQSDLLSRISTGGDQTARAMYSDDDAHVTQLMRPVWLNGIMSGFTRSDLASRAVMVDLTSISPDQRVSWDELNRGWQGDRPVIFAGLLDLLVQVLAAGDNIRPSGGNRMVEFEKILTTIDHLFQTTGVQQLRRQTQDLSDTVLDATTLGCVLRTAIEGTRSESVSHFGSGATSIFGTFATQEFMTVVAAWADLEQRRVLPDTPKKLGEALKRLAPDLERVLSVRIRKARVKGLRGLTIEDLQT